MILASRPPARHRQAGRRPASTAPTVTALNPGARRDGLGSQDVQVWAAGLAQQLVQPGDSPDQFGAAVTHAVAMRERSGPHNRL